MAELTPEQKLAALLSASAAPARDPVFCAEVMERVARRRAWARMGAAAPWAVSGGLVAWALQPVLGPSVESLGQALVLPGAILGVVAILGLSAMVAARRLTP